MTGRRRLTLLILAFPALGAAASEPRVREVGALEARTAALLYSGQEAGDLGSQSWALAVPGEGAKARVAWVVDIDGGSLLATASDAPTLTLEVYVYALGPEGRLADSRAQAVEIDVEADRDVLSRGGLKLLGDLDLPAGRFELRSLVLERGSGRLSLRRLPLTVPAPGAPFAGSPIVPAAADRWRVVHAERGTPLFPLRLDGAEVLPATAAAAAEPLYLVGGGERWQARLTAGGEVLPAGLELGGVVRLAELGSVALRRATLHPGKAAAGRYRLTLTPAQGEGVELPLWIAGEGHVAAVSPAEGSAPPERRSLFVPSGGPMARGTLPPAAGMALAAYREALARRQAGDGAASLAAMDAMETAVGRASGGAAGGLREAEVAVVRQLALEDVESLVPLVDLHLGLFEHYHRQRRYWLATHARNLGILIARLYVRQSADPEAERREAEAFVRIASYLHRIGSLAKAEAEYRAALDHDPEHPAALLGVAAIREAYGDYRTVVRFLERLEATGAMGPEERLRLGINLRRTGEAERAVAVLRGVTGEPGPAWVAAVAVQELARTLVEEGGLEEAQELLVAAIEAQAEVPRLRLQLAALLDRLGRHREAAGLVDLDAAAQDVASPRLRYAEPPAAAIDGGSQLLAAAAAARLGTALAHLHQMQGLPAP